MGSEEEGQSSVVEKAWAESRKSGRWEERVFQVKELREPKVALHAVTPTAPGTSSLLLRSCGLFQSHGLGVVYCL